VRDAYFFDASANHTRISGGVIVGNGLQSHLYYVGDDRPFVKLAARPSPNPALRLPDSLEAAISTEGRTQCVSSFEAGKSLLI
jgi:hypothetical protein